VKEGCYNKNMVNISKRKVKEDILIAISDNLIKYIAHIKNKKQAQLFINSFFTKSERLLFAKRFTIVVMLERGYSYSEIEDTLKVSDRTIAKIEQKRERGDFIYLANHVKKACAKTTTKQEGDIWDLLEVILRAGMPPRGRGRWKKFYELTEK